ncbi:TPA: hypothetical protein N0F65_010402 [Lagenidium giganteum]|uniref:Tyrosinase copper-binding domain-containing protein n=1 Tax=Lagenidium giganteum TaxID=4803 RepID=A0AAV2YTA9_9STRA|nr:TPA: hypothetical protein N0F65_010402 [Lagenidium giganteum]
MVKLVHVALAGLALGASLDATADAARVRKAWRNLSDQEKENFKGAVASAMKSGLHYQFALVHASPPNSIHAHGNCGFLLWHRKYMLAYENMLRDQGDQFKDVTIPYWNYYNDHDRQLSKGVQCKTILECSQFLQEMGGLGDKNGKIKIRGRETEGHCGDDSISKNACDGSGNCGCVPRGDWDTETSFLALARSKTLAAMINVKKAATDDKEALTELSGSVEGTFHTAVHSALGGIMGNYGSPFDPVFFGHHATVDLVHYVHNHCYYEEAGPDSIGKFSKFARCQVKDNKKDKVVGSIAPKSKIVMVSKDDRVQKYFDAIGSTYEAFDDATTMGDNSYTYELDDHIQNFLKTNRIICPNNNGDRRLEVEADHKRHGRHHHHHDHNRDYEKSDEEVMQITDVLSECTQELIKEHSELSLGEVYEQVGMLECEVVRQLQGKDFEDYSREFLEGFNMPKTMHRHCYVMMQKLSECDGDIKVSDQCKQRLGELTGTDLLEGFGQQYGNTTYDTPAPAYTDESSYGTHVRIHIHRSE